MRITRSTSLCFAAVVSALLSAGLPSGAGAYAAPSDSASRGLPTGSHQNKAARVTNTPKPVGVAGNWVMTFHDSFNGTALDLAKWTPYWYGGEGSPINGVATHAANATVTGGNLVLTLATPTSGAFVHTTQAPTRFQLRVGGYAEARIYFPGDSTDGVYNWPAWWCFGDVNTWPTSGENDIAEGLVGNMTANYHGGTAAAPQDRNFYPVGTWYNSYHTYGIYRKTATSDVYWDGRLVATYPTRDTAGPQELVFDVGAYGPAHTGTASQVKVNYVRAWRSS